MKSSLKKSLYLSLAAVSFVAAAGAATTNASAKTYAKIASYPSLIGTSSTRNVTLNGTNAIYTKAGTLKGARVVASKTTVKNLAKSTSSKKNFRVYDVAVTNRGSVYYKVVSFDKAYRGWIYGGKSASKFAGGINSYDTFTEGTLTDAQKAGTYKIANTGTANDNKTVTYKVPAWTQYKVGRVITDSTPYKDSTFKITAVGTRTREGDTWVKIEATNSADSKANGWILQSGLKAQDAASFTVNYVNGTKSVGSAKVDLSSTTTSVDVTKSGTTEYASIQKNLPAGYAVDSFGQGATTVANGSSIIVYVTPAKATTQIQTQLVALNASKTSGVAQGANLYNLLSAAQQNQLVSATKDTSVQVPVGSTITVAQQEAVASLAKVAPTFTDKNGVVWTLQTSQLSAVTPALATATPSIQLGYTPSK